MGYERRAKLISLFVTVTISAAVIILLLYLYLSPSSNNLKTEWLAEDTAELLFDGEYVKYGDYYLPNADDHAPSPNTNIEEAKPADDLDDAGEVAPEPDQMVSNTVESPMKVEPKQEADKTGSTKEDQENKERERKQKESADKINKRVNFGNSSSDKEQAHGQSGSPNGNSSTGSVFGLPGASLAGRTLASWSFPKSQAIGSITIRIKVNRLGNVVSAEYLKGSGSVASVQATRESCIQAAKKSTFSPDSSAPVEQFGTITYTFE